MVSLSLFAIFSPFKNFREMDYQNLCYLLGPIIAFYHYSLPLRSVNSPRTGDIRIAKQVLQLLCFWWRWLPSDFRFLCLRWVCINLAQFPISGHLRSTSHASEFLGCSTLMMAQECWAHPNNP